MSRQLNNQQLAVVQAPLQNMLVIAGAGTGKTTTLIERIAYIIEEYQLRSHQIIAVTFTNKAAREIKERLIERFQASNLSGSIRQMLIGTFHGICIKIMRESYKILEIAADFEVIDREEQVRVIKSIYTQLFKDNETFKKLETSIAKRIADLINTAKDNLLRANAIESMRKEYRSYFDHDLTFDLFAQIYREYERQCKLRSLVDFAETHLAVYELFINHGQVMIYYQQRFKYIMVDECQDTNMVQYMILRLLSNSDNYTLMVGDDDQSIYSWRGAVVDNMYRFENEFPNVARYKLEYNYRSTKPILDLANLVISSNENRIIKNLETPLIHEHSITPKLVTLNQATDEAKYVSEQISKYRSEGIKLKDMVVLYRSSFLTRSVEEALIAQKIPYEIYGNSKFLDRLEIKTAIGYLKLSLNPHSNASLAAVLNVPTRGFGDKFMQKLQSFAYDNDATLMNSLDMIYEISTTTVRNKIRSFKELVEDLCCYSLNNNLTDSFKFIIDRLEIHKAFKKDPDDHFDRLRNLNELVISSEEFIETSPLDSLSPEEMEDIDNRLASYPSISIEQKENLAVKFLFLDRLDLREVTTKSKDQIDDQIEQDSLNLMTIHSAKGLEFKNVFVIGVEEGIIPSSRSETPAQIEEERRLLYVAITRAKQHLYLTHTKSRNEYGRSVNTVLSSFIIDENVQDLLELESHTNKISNVRRNYHNLRSASAIGSSSPTSNKLSGGMKAMHAEYGLVLIVSLLGSDQATVLRIDGDKEFCQCSISDLIPLK